MGRLAGLGARRDVQHGLLCCLMARAFSFNGGDWLAEPTGRVNSVGLERFSIIRFWQNETGEQVEGQLAIEPDGFGEINEDQIINALSAALGLSKG